MSRLTRIGLAACLFTAGYGAGLMTAPRPVTYPSMDCRTPTARPSPRPSPRPTPAPTYRSLRTA